MATKKKPRLLVDGYQTEESVYVRAWKEGREYAVQVWKGETPTGEPAGDWGMPGALGLAASVAQAIKQTR
jgi:hypothetical protein